MKFSIYLKACFRNAYLYIHTLISGRLLFVDIIYSIQRVIRGYQDPDQTSQVAYIITTPHYCQHRNIHNWACEGPGLKYQVLRPNQHIEFMAYHLWPIHILSSLMHIHVFTRTFISTLPYFTTFNTHFLLHIFSMMFLLLLFRFLTLPGNWVT